MPLPGLGFPKPILESFLTIYWRRASRAGRLARTGNAAGIGPWRNFQALTERYLELQESDAPVHLWPV